MSKTAHGTFSGDSSSFRGHFLVDGKEFELTSLGAATTCDFIVAGATLHYDHENQLHGVYIIAPGTLIGGKTNIRMYEGPNELRITGFVPDLCGIRPLKGKLCWINKQ